MKLSFGERLILVGQYRLLSTLHNGEKDDNIARAIEILTNGYEDFYGELAPGMQLEPFPQDVADEVSDILQMFRELQWHKEKFDPSVTDHPRFNFWGFDANNSHEHLKFAKFLHSSGEFEELGNRLLWNSHSDTIETYYAMVRIWRSVPGGLKLTQDNALKILEAAI